MYQWKVERLIPKETLEYITNRSNQEIDNIDNVVRKVMDKFNEIKYGSNR